MLSSVTLVIMSAGSATRFKSKKIPKKQWLRVGDKPLWLYVADKFASMFDFDKVVVTCYKNEQRLMRKYCDYEIVVGGDTRQESLENALQNIDSEYVLVTDTARACVDKEIIKNILSCMPMEDCVVPFVGVSDTAILKDTKIEREELKLIQTPQLSRTKILKEAFTKRRDFTDESSAMLFAGSSVKYIAGSKDAKKLTYAEEIRDIPCLEAPSRDVFVGSGFDIHAFEEGKKMLLGGVEIDASFGFKAHSDGDVLIHSLIDALLGAVGGGDIGEWFPDTDAKYKGVDSKVLLSEILNFVNDVGYEIVNCDITILAEQPKISPYKEIIEKSLADMLEIPRFRVNLKATTAEKMGFVGRKEGIFVHSTVSLKYYEWDKK